MGRRPSPVLVLDFDGVIHGYTGWKGADQFDEPNPGAVEFVTKAVEHFRVVVVSSRCNHHNGVKMIEQWLTKWGFPDSVTVSAERPPAYVTLDDRAVTFQGFWPPVETLLNFKPWWQD